MLPCSCPQQVPSGRGAPAEGGRSARPTSSRWSRRRGALTRKEVVRALRDAGKGHGAGTIAKALADLTSAGELVNPKDKKGYRLAGWRRDETPSLFD